MFYTYYCPTCGKEEEFVHGMTEEPKYHCENDNTIMKKKITGGCGEIYKGVGWPRKGTGTAPKPKRYKEHYLVGPRHLKKAIKH